MSLAAARKEVASKTDRQIERETAANWAARAIACYERAAKLDGDARLNWFHRATDYHHEALEHAATACDRGRTLKKIERQLDKAARRARRKK